MRIEPLESDRASEAAKQIYAGLERQHGRISTFYKMLAYRPEVLKGFLQLEAAVLGADALPDRFKDLAYLRASLLNGCAR
jgi:alkylhydroperoxidase family enzyme